eukprot:COSAG06_NODE_2277_length_7190_cov_3.824848_1_plen_315_part_10
MNSYRSRLIVRRTVRPTQPRLDGFSHRAADELNNHDDQVTAAKHDNKQLPALDTTFAQLYVHVDIAQSTCNGDKDNYMEDPMRVSYVPAKNKRNIATTTAALIKMTIFDIFTTTAKTNSAKTQQSRPLNSISGAGIYNKVHVGSPTLKSIETNRPALHTQLNQETVATGAPALNSINGAGRQRRVGHLRDADSRIHHVHSPTMAETSRLALHIKSVSTRTSLLNHLAATAGTTATSIGMSTVSLSKAAATTTTNHAGTGILSSAYVSGLVEPTGKTASGPAGTTTASSVSMLSRPDPPSWMGATEIAIDTTWLRR